MNNSEFIICSKSCFIYLRKVLAPSRCECEEGRRYFGCLTELRNLIQESFWEAWFTRGGLHSFTIFHWQFPSVTSTGCGPRASILERVKLIRDCKF